VVFYFQAPRDGIYEFDTRGSDFDTTLHLTTQACDGSVLDCNDDYYSLDARVVTQLRADDGVYLILQSYSSYIGEYHINFTRTDVPVATSCPNSNLGSSLGQPIVVQEVVAPAYQEYPYEFACNGGPTLLSYSWTAPSSGNYVFSTSGSNFDTVLALRTSCNGSLYDCNDDSYTTTSRIEYYFEAGQSIVAEISAYGGYVPDDWTPEFGGPTLVFSIWAN
jgi:hypothetical protein